MHFSPHQEARSLLVFEGLVCSLNQVQMLVSYYLLDGMAGPIYHTAVVVGRIPNVTSQFDQLTDDSSSGEHELRFGFVAAVWFSPSVTVLSRWLVFGLRCPGVLGWRNGESEDARRSHPGAACGSFWQFRLSIFVNWQDELQSFEGPLVGFARAVPRLALPDRATGLDASAAIVAALRATGAPRKLAVTAGFTGAGTRAWTGVLRNTGCRRAMATRRPPSQPRAELPFWPCYKARCSLRFQGVPYSVRPESMFVCLAARLCTFYSSLEHALHLALRSSPCKSPYTPRMGS